MIGTLSPVKLTDYYEFDTAGWTGIGLLSFDVLSLVDSVVDSNTGAKKSYSDFEIEAVHPYRLVLTRKGRGGESVTGEPGWI